MAIELPNIKTTVSTTVEHHYSVRFTEADLVELLNNAGYPVTGDTVLFTLFERSSILIVEWVVESTTKVYNED